MGFTSFPMLNITQTSYLDTMEAQQQYTGGKVQIIFPTNLKILCEAIRQE